LELNFESRRMTSYIDPATLMRIKSLELRAKLVVEGFQSGGNRSPYHGFSVEFTEYRQYSPGDDPRYLDWRLYARSDRYYIKRFEDETNLRCHLILDNSRSMGFGTLAYTKADYARTLVATLAWFLATQRDAVGLVTFDEALHDFIPARYRAGQLRRLLVALEKPVGGDATDLALPLNHVAERIRKRGVLVLVSDLLAPLDELETHLACLRAQRHEVVIFHILDPAELSFDFERPCIFYDVETGRELYADPLAVRDEYCRKLDEHLAAIRGIAGRLGIGYRQLTTDKPLETALDEYLRSRLRHGSRPARGGARSTARPAGGERRAA
jgi:uncharacterized protein (DUF58 family)